MPSPLHLADANLIIRFLTADDPKHSPAARHIFTRAATGKLTLLITDVCVAEVAWLLKSYYKFDRKDIAQWLTQVIDSPGIQTVHKPVLLDALHRYQKNNIDYIDAYHAALAHYQDIPIISFDRDFDRFSDIKRIEPH